MLADEGACCIIAYGAGVNECEIALRLPDPNQQWQLRSRMGFGGTTIASFCEQWAGTIDFMKPSVSSDPSRLVVLTDQRLGRKETEHADYRLRLSPEQVGEKLPTPCQRGHP
jgi:hypothetical protein